ncbi:M14 family zinc carboxypeptidase [Alteromonas gilva]|uniref:M14 family zinc carboxypeptidase n=1 Tax=Alteromonas gilva TaxID=2987522 RepID=A0ABT5L6T7_9ALTE|nr:M14 family zinc carboxypeptidase [Alteromonas gilva]MDC8832196.1 M14 family zinc carboxypeptidase [Alteromonas gilva]
MKNAHPHTTVQVAETLWQTHNYRQLDKPHLRFNDIEPIIKALAERADITLTTLGHTCAQRPIYRLTTGHGPMVILAWTQMHGDEPTATAAVLDWLRILPDLAATSLPSDWQSLVTIHVIPMLNPDGAERCTRVNEQGIDINRDARQLQTPEGNILWQQVNELHPDVAFNLHDQNPYYTAGNSAYPSTIAFLAPAFHPDKHVDAPRLRAKQLIACMAETLSHWLPCHIGRYDDTYSLRSFGDNIAGTGASTILIESGAHPQDPHRQVARKMNVIALHSALDALLCNRYQEKSLADYYAIPDNVEDGLTDVKFGQVKQTIHHTTYTCDISVNIDAGGNGSISHIGDLSTQSAFKTVGAYDAVVLPLKAKHFSEPFTLTKANYLDLLAAGVCYFVGDSSTLNNETGMPVLCLAQPLDTPALFPGAPAYWLMTDADNTQWAVLNGQVIEL